MIREFVRALVPGSIRRWVQRRRLTSAMDAFPRRVVEHRYGDVTLKVELADPLAAGWYDHDWDPLHELEVLGQRVVPGARVFDLGAHQGVVGLMLAHRVGPAGEVVLVEPNPHNFQMCGRNAGLNNMSWVKCVQAAVGNQEGTLSFNCGLNGQAGELSDYGGLIEVPCLTIDRLTDRFGRPDVVFIDVEGFECRALAGATRTFAMNPSWFVEVHIGAGLEAAGGSVDEVLRHFPAERFERYVHTERDGPLGDRPIALESVDPSILAKERFFLTALAR